MVPAAVFQPQRGRRHVVDIFDEVDEDVRRERMQAMAKKYGPVVGGAVVLVIVAVAGVTFWRDYELGQRQQAGATFLDASRAQQADRTVGVDAFGRLAAEGPAGYPLLARFKQAEAAAAAGDRDTALAALNGVDAMEAPERYKALARLLALGLRSYEEGAEALLPLVEPLAAEGQPWRPLALEQAAMLEWKLGRYADARKRLETLLADPATPGGTRRRAEAVLTALPEG